MKGRERGNGMKKGGFRGMTGGRLRLQRRGCLLTWEQEAGLRVLSL